MVTIHTTKHPARSTGSFRISANDGGKELGHVYLYLIRNDLHKEPYGFVEDLSVEEVARGRGIARILMNTLSEVATKAGCYKIVANCHRKRKVARALYLSLGYHAHGREFRIDIK